MCFIKNRDKKVGNWSRGSVKIRKPKIEEASSKELRGTIRRRNVHKRIGNITWAN